jgi:hypothetical protein
MKHKTLLLTAFILVAVAQLFVPYQMISKQAGYAETGTEFKFKTDNRVNPNFNGIGSDLSGKFIWLKFREDHIKIADKKDWENIRNAYVEFTTDSAGFAKILSVSIKKPISHDWVRTSVNVDWKDSTRLQVSYAFSPYYIRDTQKDKVESVIKNGLCDTLKTNFLRIKIKENQFVVVDLMVDGVPFKEMIRDTVKSN